MRALFPLFLISITLTSPAFAKGGGGGGGHGPSSNNGLSKVKHVIVLMQENHSFDNYFGVLPYVAKGPYHPGYGQCSDGDHSCVDGLTCVRNPRNNELTCANANIHEDGTVVHAFHDTNRCVGPDLDHSWVGTHVERNFAMPDNAEHGRSDGFVRQNDETEQKLGETMGFYTESEIPFYYDLAQKFAIDDRYFCSTLGPTFPNRSYLLAATSFGHLTTSDTFPPAGGYKPITGTIFDLLEAHDVSWNDYFQDAPQGGSFRPFGATGVDPHFLPLPVLLSQLSGASGTPPLAQVVFVDPNFGIITATQENDEHPPTDIQRGQAYVSQVVNAFRNGPYWNDSVLFITYDEHGGFYDHVTPPKAHRPDDIAPGQCRDLSNPPASLLPGGGAECAANPLSASDTSVKDAIALCPALAANPTGPYPKECAHFDELGLRVPFIAVSPFSRPHYVSHTAGDHTSMLAFIERTFMPETEKGDHGGERPHVTRRDLNADPLLDLFDFDNAPSKNIKVIAPTALPTVDCTP
jgi:phospholipase C